MPSTAKAPEGPLRPLTGATAQPPAAALPDADPSIAASAFWAPERVVLSAWLGHLPFAFWITAIQRPKVLVELGTHNGASYSAFCQAIAKQGIDAKAYAVDTWEGDPHAGQYGEEVYAELTAYLEPRYGAFSRLIRSTFDDALPQFADGCIDLLHIDGCHTYEAVRHDFESWRPKLSDRAIVLFHDTEVRHGDFGVWRFWAEIRHAYPSFNFLHHHGLGVLAVGGEQNELVRRFLAADGDDGARDTTRQMFARLGAAVQTEFELRLTVDERNRLAFELSQETARRQQAQREATTRLLESTIAAQQRQLVDDELGRLRRKQIKLTESAAWRWTAPVRTLARATKAAQKKLRAGRKGKATSVAAGGGAASALPATYDVGAGVPLPSLLPPTLHRYTSCAVPDPFRRQNPVALPDEGGLRVCCLVHVYYVELWEELAADLRNLADIPHDIFISFVDTTVTDEAVEHARADFPHARFHIAPNRGRDAGGIFNLLRQVDLTPYDAVLVLHSKQSLAMPKGHGALWRWTLIEPLVGSPTIARLNVELMANDPSVGLIGAASCCSTFSGGNAAMMAMLAAQLGLRAPEFQAPFVAGAMFMIRPQLMADLKQGLANLEFRADDGSGPGGPADGHLEHGVERFYGTLVAARGLRVVWRDTRATEIQLYTHPGHAAPSMRRLPAPEASRPDALCDTLEPAPNLPHPSPPLPRVHLAERVRRLRKFVKHRLSGKPPKLRAATQTPTKSEYQDWVDTYDTLTDDDRAKIAAHIEALSRRPLITVLMPVYNTDQAQLREAIESVRAQLYPNWELCIADDASTVPHIRQVLDDFRDEARIKVVLRDRNGHISVASNSALALAEGEFVALMDHDDLLPPQALYELAVAINDHPDVDLIYTDEDQIDEHGRRQRPYFKTDWDPDLLLAHNMISHLGAYRRSIMVELGGFRTGYEGSQDYDLALRFSRATTADRIHHIPRVLYHWRQHSSGSSFSKQALERCVQAARQATHDHLEALGVVADILPLPATQCWSRIRFSLPTELPLVSVIVPTRDRSELLAKCLDGLLRQTDYPKLEVIVVDNESTERVTLNLLAEIRADERVRVLPFAGPFNYSAMNNRAVLQARGDIVLLLNNDIEVIDDGWLKEMVSHAVRPEVGAVGAKLIYPDQTVQHAGVVLGVGGVANHFGHRADRNDPGYFGLLGIPRSVSAVSAACLAVRRELFVEVGGLDAENLKVAFNDVDFCLRLRQKGYRNIYTPFAELYHLESVSRGSDMDPDKFERFRSEVFRMIDVWGDILLQDPYYNPNFGLESGNFQLARPPRQERPWVRASH